MIPAGRNFRIAAAVFLTAFALALFGARAAGQERQSPRFVVSLYHFNIQYVLDDNTIKSKIVTQSFEPLLDLYSRHPEWGCDISLQGMFLEYIAAFHPAVMDKLKRLADRGQVELISYGYSNALTLAYPLHDRDWNDALADGAFAKFKLQRAPVVFGAEGQFGAGMLYAMKGKGFFIGLLPANALLYYHADVNMAPVYKAWQGFVLPGGADFTRSDFSVKWNWFDYGEAALTKPTSPTEDGFAFNAEASANHESQLAAYAAEGRIICRISDYVKYVRTTRYAPPDLPVLPDSTWSVKAADNFFLWMGWYATPTEKDIEILSAAYAARNELALAETLVNYAKQMKEDTAAEESLLRDAWKAELGAEATGATGWHPSQTETDLAFTLATRAKDTAVNIIRSLKMKLNLPAVEIDSFDGSVKAAGSEQPETYPQVRCPVTPDISGATGTVRIECRRVSDSEIQMDISLAPSRWGMSVVSVTFPLLGDRLQFSPGLMETYFADFDFADFTATNFVLPLSNGLVGFGDGQTFIITHNDTSHIAAHVDPSQKAIAFLIKNAPTTRYTLKFSLVSGDPADALKMANRINTFPHGLR